MVEEILTLREREPEPEQPRPSIPPEEMPTQHPTIDDDITEAKTEPRSSSRGTGGRAPCSQDSSGDVGGLGAQAWHRVGAKRQQSAAPMPGGGDRGGGAGGSGVREDGDAAPSTSSSPSNLPPAQLELDPGPSDTTPTTPVKPASTARPTLRPIRARTATASTFTPHLAPVMSRESSAEDVREGASGNGGNAESGMSPHASASGRSSTLLVSPDSIPPASLPPPALALHPSLPEAGPSRPRKSARSFSAARPPITLRTASYNPTSPRFSSPQLAPGSPRGTSPRLTPTSLSTASGSGSTTLAAPEQDPPRSVERNLNVRVGLKRRISTPSMVRKATKEGDDEAVAAQHEVQGPGPHVRSGQASGSGSGSGTQTVLASGKTRTETRARATSTSLVVPAVESALEPTIRVFKPSISASPPSLSRDRHKPDLTVTLSSPEQALRSESPVPTATRTDALLTSVYETGESYLRKLVDLVRPGSRSALQRRGSDDSEKSLPRVDSGSLISTARSSEDSLGLNAGQNSARGRYWGLRKSEEAEPQAREGYFSATPLRVGSRRDPANPEFEAALSASSRHVATLPTPALSAHSLSGGRTGRRVSATAAENANASVGTGWLMTVVERWMSGIAGGKTGEVLRDLGWTVGLLVVLFLVTGLIVLLLLNGLPILKHFPYSTTDVQLLSAEVRAYMSSSDVGWWHVIGILFTVGLWTHAWSVPGAVVVNVLCGSILQPIPALLLLTLITATGSLCSYLLSRPLAPLIAVLFPKPLALVRAALAPQSVPSPHPVTVPGATVTPIQISADPSDPPIGAQSGSSAIWRRLLIMRSMGIVPWSGMNVACGVVGVDWKIFWLTTAAGSASWSYVTASVGNILSRLALPTAVLATSSVPEAEDAQSGESISSLLRDPALIAKLVFLTGLTILPVLMKRKSRGPALDTPGTTPRESFELSVMAVNEKATEVPETPVTFARDGMSRMNNNGMNGTDGVIKLLGNIPPTPTTPISPLTQSLARFTPTPAMFDLLSFGRTLVRQGGRVGSGAMRDLVAGVRGLVGR